MIFASMLIACADNIVVASPEYTQPIQDTTDTNSTPVYYDMAIGSMCEAMNVQSLETTGQCQSDVETIAMNWFEKCYYTRTATEYINYTLDQIVKTLTYNLLFDYNFVNSLITQVSNCGTIVYIYNTNSGSIFIYIERVGDGKGFN